VSDTVVVVYGHVNPYGNFRLDTRSRLSIDPARSRMAYFAVGTRMLGLPQDRKILESQGLPIRELRAA